MFKVLRYGINVLGIIINKVNHNDVFQMKTM